MKYKIKEGLVWEEINEDVVVLDPEQGKYFNLNKTAGEIWKSLKKPLTEEQIVKIFCMRYKGEDRAKIAREIKECLVKLSKFKVVKKK